MLMRTWRFLAVLLAALSTGASWCHVLELPAKLAWDGPLYVAVQNEPPGLYLGFGTVGAAVEVAAVLGVAGLAFLVRRRRPASRLTLAAAAALGAALLLWWLRIAPANAVMAAWTPDTVPADWLRWRDQWEYTHAANFVLKLVALGALVASVLAETPTAAVPASAAHARPRRVA